MQETPFFYAPIVIVVLAEGTASTFVDGGSCVLKKMMIAAASPGLGTVLVHGECEIFDGSRDNDFYENENFLKLRERWAQSLWISCASVFRNLKMQRRLHLVRLTKTKSIFAVFIFV